MENARPIAKDHTSLLLSKAQTAGVRIMLRRTRSILAPVTLHVQVILLNYVAIRTKACLATSIWAELLPELRAQARQRHLGPLHRRLVLLLLDTLPSQRAHTGGLLPLPFLFLY